MTVARDPRIAALLAEAERRWGRGSLVRLGDVAEPAEVEVVPSGFPALDAALGTGGLPCGRISEIFGPDSSGKHALAAHLIAQCQRAEGVAAYIDVGHRLDPEQMKVVGVDLDSLLVARPGNAPLAMELAIRLARGGGIRLLIFDATDSYQPAIPNSSLITPLLLRRLVSAVDKHGVAFVFITSSQPSTNPQPSVLSPQSSRGGQALRFFASIRLEMERSEWIRRGTEVVGCRSTVRVAKNKLSPPHREATVELPFYRFPPSMPAVQPLQTVQEAASRAPIAVRAAAKH
jgi:recombination protein RecA